MDEVEQPIEVQAGIEIVAEQGSANGKTPEATASEEVRATSTVCMPCLIARVALLAIATGLLIWAILEERKRAATQSG